MAKSGEIRESRKASALGVLAGWIMRGLSATLRFEVNDECGVMKRGGPVPAPAIFALWHNRIVVIPPIWRKTFGRFRPCVVLTSASHDGATLARAMSVFGLGAVRGSSSRRGAAALIGLKRALREGSDVCITPDGPRGPRYEVHPGMVKLAQSSGAPIVLIHATFESAWRLKSWDRLVIPKPFSRVHITYGPMLEIPSKLDEAAFEAECERVQTALRQGTDDA
ncbi:lysophospholipid acyltransferase family protein [Luteolibacter pohnpeiensis]|uniref:Lysophospholipid acyltransferase family protein n=1 Tax=Luteolibacter pohnpeiensis TaxID=454153 RepID=A0A934SAI7_9BACT|nr:lysophospholipid acyltransferase family protein [Luteolibacter pohnpeiensis]MBK1882339.1 lysophospholipid acyltransferase family protein [Luteolibacter pohnpeiensis]